MVADYHPDVLDLLGRTPRELGWLHVHLEPVVASGPRGLVTAWLQAAFEPHGDARLELSWGPEDRRQSAAFPVPALGVGAALRWRFAVELPAGVEELRVDVVAPHQPKAERVRQPWKLLDTVVQTPHSDEAMGVTTALMIGGVLAGSLLAGAAVLAAAEVADHQARVSREEHRPNLDHLTLPVQRVENLDAAGAGVEELWRPGKALPESAPVPQVAPKAEPAAKRVAEATRCATCRCTLDASDLRMGVCPGCGALID